MVVDPWRAGDDLAAELQRVDAERGRLAQLLDAERKDRERAERNCDYWQTRAIETEAALREIKQSIRYAETCSNKTLTAIVEQVQAERDAARKSLIDNDSAHIQRFAAETRRTSTLIEALKAWPCDGISCGEDCPTCGGSGIHPKAQGALRDVGALPPAEPLECGHDQRHVSPIGFCIQCEVARREASRAG